MTKKKHTVMGGKSVGKLAPEPKDKKTVGAAPSPAPNRAQQVAATPSPPTPTPMPVGPIYTPSNPAPTPKVTTNATPFDGNELGVVGLKVNNGYVWEEYLPQLRGIQGMRVYQTMGDSDATCGALLNMFYALLLGVDWTCEPVDQSPEGLAGAEFGKSLMDDMSLTWRDTISEILSMLQYGWSYFELVAKRRVGPDQKDPSKRSKFEDGCIGIRKIARRAQDSLQRWQIDNNGGIQGMWQLPITGGNLTFLPIDKSLLFRTRIDKNNPEGFSLLRRAYNAWWKKKTAEDFEAVGIERDLAGLPVVSIPNEYLTGTDSNSLAVKALYTGISRDLKFNEQGGIVIPSDTYVDSLGNPTTIKLVTVDLLKGSGVSKIDADKIIRRYDESIARTVLAEFLMLGGGAGKGSFALSKSKVDMFIKSMEHLLIEIATVFNRHALPRMWGMNGFDKRFMPSYQPGKIAPTDLQELGSFISAIATAGMPLFPDAGVEGFLRDAAGMPAVGTTDDNIE